MLAAFHVAANACYHVVTQASTNWHVSHSLSTRSLNLHSKPNALNGAHKHPLPPGSLLLQLPLQGGDIHMAGLAGIFHPVRAVAAHLQDTGVLTGERAQQMRIAPSPADTRLHGISMWVCGPFDTQADIIAGISVGFMVVPQSMSYANLAGLPTEYGLYGAFLPVLAYALVGSSRQLAVGPVAVTSLIIGSSLKDLVEGSSEITNPNKLTAAQVRGEQQRGEGRDQAAGVS